jgi:FtsP/CotA-like multicopper oxidase with cupredoxin domain
MAVFLSAAVMAAMVAAAPPIAIQDNSRAAGQRAGNVLTVRLVVDVGSWRPNGNAGPPLDVRAFGEEGRPLSVPAPLIRAPQGTDVSLTIRNALNQELRVFGLCARPGTCEPLALAAGQSRDVRFSLSTPGTYYYWASARAQSLISRPREDSQLGGVIIVDPPEGADTDHVMVISMFTDGVAGAPCGPASEKDDTVFAINGASWPNTARLHYTTGEPVHWRVVNLSCDQHAMHLHGFHFNVSSSGDGSIDRHFGGAEQKTEVTESITPGRTFGMTWTPNRAGNWLFHCHMVPHMTAGGDAAHATHDLATHAGMAGLVVGIEVTGKTSAPENPDTAVARRLSLVLREESNRYGTAPGYRMDVEGVDAPRLDAGPVPGPILVLHRGEPTEITVVNRMSEPTAIHWHGIEIDSYFDGVPGFGGTAGHVAQPIAPGASFVARITPPRAGTFIYHTHWHDASQLAGGLYGALLVLEPGEQYDPATDHVAIIGLNGINAPGPHEPFALNGRSKPAPIQLRAGVPNRLRLINITATNVALVSSLGDQSDLVEWKPLAKDGATLPPAQSKVRRARQPIAVGETYDFEIAPRAPQTLWLEVRRGSGEWVFQAPVLIR